MTAHRQLAGIRDDVPLPQAGPYHAAARAAALDAFGRTYERSHQHASAHASAPAFESGAPEYVVATSGDGELLVVAGAWPAAGRTCGRLVTPRELLALLLDDLTTTAVWCDEDDGAGLALTAYEVAVGSDPLVLVAARSARAVGETAGVTEVAYDGARLAAGAWAADALDAFLRDHDGDAVVLSPAVLAELARRVADADLG